MFRVQPLSDIALGPFLSNEISSYSVPAVVIYFLAALGLVVMLAAGFNYVSLTVARALERAREIGARKTLGAGRGQVVAQLLTESLLTALMATGVSVILLLLLIPGFNSLSFVQLYNVQIQMHHLLDVRLIGLFATFGTGVGLWPGCTPPFGWQAVRHSLLCAGRRRVAASRADGCATRWSACNWGWPCCSC